METISERTRKPRAAVLWPGVREEVLLRTEMETCIWQNGTERLSAEAQVEKVLVTELILLPTILEK